MAMYGLPKGFFTFHLLAESEDRMREILARAIGRRLGKDASLALTGADVFEAVTRFVEDGEPLGVAGIRDILVGNYMIYCFAGIADDLSYALKYGVRVPEYCRHHICFFVVYAECVD